MKIDRVLLRASWESWISLDNRERAGPWWLQWVWTLLFGAALAVVFTILGFFAFGSGSGAWRNVSGWLYWYGKNLLVCTIISVLIHLMFDGLRAVWATPARIGSWRPWQRSVFFGGVPLLGVLIGWPLGVELAGGHLSKWLADSRGQNLIAGSVLIALMISFAMHQWFAARTRQLDAERRATQAQLRLLQAQMEPHFLFNTLANVRSLMDHDLPKSRQMLDSFTDYLRASLTTLRSDRSRVSEELELAQTYLQLLQGRMEDRLRFSIEADEAARQQTLPPLLLQPLIENAVVHGLEPSIQGGTVQVTVKIHGEQLVLEVKDDGRGPDAPPRRSGRGGAGVALDNIRQRLLSHYGAAATLEVQSTHPGTRSRITLPLIQAPA
jgi:two-component sensor histidine kinase